MANEFVSPTLVLQDTMVRLENQTVLSKFDTREFFN